MAEFSVYRSRIIAAGRRGRVARAAARMERLLDDIPELSRAGFVIGLPAEVPLGEVVWEAVAGLAKPIACASPKLVARGGL